MITKTSQKLGMARNTQSTHNTTIPIDGRALRALRPRRCGSVKPQASPRPAQARRQTAQRNRHQTKAEERIGDELAPRTSPVG
jgi:hypothetical protein